MTPPGGVKVEKLHGGFAFTEGPAVAPNGDVYFTDIPNERIHAWTNDGKLKVVREKSGGANGLAFDAAGRLLACEMKQGRISVAGPDGKVQPLIAEFKGKAFNQTNDLVFDARGGLYFTDPYYGPERSLPQDRMAVYYLRPDGKTIERVVEKDGPIKPNGVLLAPNGKTLYVVDSEAPNVWCYTVGDDGRLTPAGNGTGKFAALQLPPGVSSTGGDGGCIDSQGNLYIAVPKAKAIQVISSTGKHLGSIAVPEEPANCAFFGPKNKSLFITAQTGVYKTDLLAEGLLLPVGKGTPKK